ncbi:sensor histidine kinase [Lentilactobacillus sp. SPB1-3]|uniref:Sensor histidine kinase n=1 Tax=Lentilactobacillus terminaliae TaxID=3003483 RepID=A0ACD5DFZ4_9LACO|nr:HAMP domain-containing sensor histidine kinase [Lentilactobacillus sp. SPB1-3]MCZ0976825.1 HAMP domain-containing sensor histidine kinase [Lentilactobacillus sp. SPB1-3]
MKLRYLVILSYVISVITTISAVVWAVNKMVLDNQSATWIIIITTVASLIGIIVALLLLHKPFKSLDKFKVLSQNIAENKFTQIKGVNSPQEFRDLANDFNQMTISLDQTFSKLKDSEQEKDMMIAQLSHDIKTPISSIKATIEAILDGVITPDQYQKYFETIDNQTTRLNQLVEELDYIRSSKFEEQHYEIKNEQISLDKLLIKILSAFQVQIDREHRDVDINIDPKANSINTDIGKLSRILFNLINNALKYSDAGTSLTISSELSDNRIKIKISDHGIGIPQDEQSKIFNRLYRVEQSRNMQTGGHGLGLYIAQDLTNQLGGRLSVTSKLHSGSIFTIDLPNTTSIVSKHSLS